MLSLAFLVASALAGPPPSAVWTYPTNGGAQISWNAVAGANNYLLYRGTSSTNEKLIATTSGTSYGDGSLTNGKTYYYYVRCQFGSTDSSDSMVASVNPGAAVLNSPLAAATPAKSAINIYWSADPHATFYLVERNDPVLGWSVIHIVTGSSTATYKDASVTNGYPYSYQVISGNGNGSGNTSASFSAVAGDVPATGPSGLWAVPEQGSIYIAWNQVPAASAYVIYKSTKLGSEGLSPYALVNGSTNTSYTDTVSNGAVAFYKIAPVDFSGTGTQSPEAEAMSGASQIGPPIAAATTLPTSIRLNWEALNEVDQYVIYRSVGNPNNFVMYAQATDVTTYTDTAVAAGTYYYYAVAGRTVDGTGLTGNGLSIIAQASAKAGTGDLPPTSGIAAQPDFGSGTIGLYWNPVPGAKSYNVYRGFAPGQETLYVESVTSSRYQATNCYYITDGNVDNFTYEFYVVRAVSQSGSEGLSSKEVSAQLLPGLPSPLVAAYAQSKSVLLAADAVQDALYYNIYRSSVDSGADGYLQIATNLLPVTGAGTFVFTDSNVTAGATYYYIITAVNIGGEGSYSAEVAATPGGAQLDPPTGTLAYSSGSTSIVVQCDAQPNAASFNVYRSTSPTLPLAPYAVGLTTPQYTDVNVTTGVVYYYAFTAVDDDGESAYSVVCSAAPGTPALEAPTLALNQHASSLILAWSAIVGATGYDVYRAGDANQDYMMISENQPGTTYNDIAVTPGIEYNYFVVPIADTGAGSRGNTVSGIPGSTPLGAPGGLAAFPGSTNVSLTFNPVLGATSYNVYVATAPNGEGSVPIAVNAGSGFDVGGLQSNTLYYFKVSAVDADGQGQLSQEVSALVGSSALAPPTLTLSVSGSSLKLLWTAVSQATQYNIYRQIYGGNYLLYKSVTGLTYMDSSLTAGATYNYYVAAVNSTGQGSSSNTVSGSD